MKNCPQRMKMRIDPLRPVMPQTSEYGGTITIHRKKGFFRKFC